MTFDLHVSLGELLVAASFILSVVGAYTRLSERLIVLETKVNDLWERRTGPRH